MRHRKRVQLVDLFNNECYPITSYTRPSEAYKSLALWNRIEHDNTIHAYTIGQIHRIVQPPFSLYGLSPGFRKPLMSTSSPVCCSQYFMISSIHSDTRTRGTAASNRSCSTNFRCCCRPSWNLFILASENTQETCVRYVTYGEIHCGQDGPAAVKIGCVYNNNNNKAIIILKIDYMCICQ